MQQQATKKVADSRGLAALLAAARRSVSPLGPVAGHFPGAGEVLPGTDPPASPLPSPTYLLSLSNSGPCRFDVVFWLTEPADVQLDLVDARGRNVVGIARRGLAAQAAHRVTVVLEGLGLPAGSYRLQLRIPGSEAAAIPALPLTLTASEVPPAQPVLGRGQRTLALRKAGAQASAQVPHLASA